MATIEARQEQVVTAPANEIYRILSDYREHHPRILPPAFSNLRVEEGGVGAGTVFSIRLTLGGRARDLRMRVEEPEPGRVLVERDADRADGLVTTFTVTPDGDRRSRVEIATTFPSSGGVQGVAERVLAPRMLKRLYADELQRLDEYARTASKAA